MTLIDTKNEVYVHNADAVKNIVEQYESVPEDKDRIIADEKAKNIRNNSYIPISDDSTFILDLIRVIACEMVVIGHLLWFTDAIFIGTKLVQRPKFLFIAQIGVILFFLISGIVISNSIFKKLIKSNKDSYNFLQYFIDRFARIYSGLIPCIFLIVFIDYIHIHVDLNHYITFFGNIDSVYNFKNLLGTILMLQNIPRLGIGTVGDAFQLWTLNIEWWLYLSFGWIIFNLKQILNLNYKYIFIAIIFSIFPCWLFLTNQYQNLIVVWYLGVLITLIIINIKMPEIIFRNGFKIFLFFMFLTFIRLFVLLNNDYSVYDLTFEIILSLAILSIIIFLNNRVIFKNIKIKIITTLISKYSYTLYLIHFSIISLIFSLNYWNISSINLAIFSFLAVNVISFGIAYFTEMRYKDLSKWIKSILNKDKLLI